MSKIGIFVGSTTGKTEDAAEIVKKEFGGDEVATIYNMDGVNPKDFNDYQNLIIASPTWNIGDLQSHWEEFFDKLKGIDFKGKKVAYFGTGDQIGYGDNFQDAIGILEEEISSLGGITVGHWPTDGYDFTESKAVKDGKFIGLALDEDNQPELTEERIKTWVAQLKTDFGI
ncbi:MAG: flavodoxin FldA [Okeania sp. SIO3I5]|uniref:flavodoxin FldA n=1 Tax=Okeania sp. SIO3I5 TaxID=2607805 RepID=UPI0013BB7B5D|nr:flavodoxin FldA [Okeania sp. SIO3I5]NEQ36654.1 flavodoxin FldA [Okeania sp. SIO3I5]